MLVDRDQVVQLLLSQGQDDAARRAEDELPAQVDTERDAQGLQALGVDVGDLPGSTGAGFG